MPHIQIDRLPKSEVKIRFQVTNDEAAPYIEQAAKHLSEHRPLPGFRPGHVPLEAAKRAYGDMALLEQALEQIVRAFYVKTILSEGLQTIGSPTVNVDKLVPGDLIEFHVIVTVEPEIKKLPDLSACKIEVKKKTVGEKEVNDVLEQMRKMRRTETKTDRAATKEDAITVDVEMTKDGVIIEGGTGKDYKIYLSEPHYLPGFAEALLDMKAGEEKRISVTFPQEHYQKHLAGQEAQVAVKATAVHELTLPPIDDAFAQGVGVPTAEELRAKIRENLTLEVEQKSSEAAEIELLEKLADATEMGDVPELLLNEEVRRMIAELQEGVEEQGASWTDYLSSLKKTSDDLRLEFIPQALRRIKIALLMKRLAKERNIVVEETAVDAEIDRLLGTLRSDDLALREKISSPDYRDYVTTHMKHRRLLEELKKECLVT